MSVHIYLAPAAAGKTAYVLGLVREAAQGLQCTPRVCLPTQLQVRSWRRRLARGGGTIGVQLLTFDGLYAECLNAAGEVYHKLSALVQYRLIRATVDDLTLTYYASLTGYPGFIRMLQGLIDEWKASRITPDGLGTAVAALGDEPRLRELVRIYAAYQKRLQQQHWADRAGLGWLAVEALEERAPEVGCGWPLLVVDGFDNTTSVQMALLQVLARRVGNLVVTLTGAADGSERPLVHRRFRQTCRRLQDALGVAAEPLPQCDARNVPALAHLEAGLYRGEAHRVDADGAVECVEAPNRTMEARAALRWLKKQLVHHGLGPGDVALLARDVSQYQDVIAQIAAEFGLPIRLVGGFRLRTNPAVAALLDLLRLVLPLSAADPQPALPRRLVIEAWRSPYYDWSAWATRDRPEPIGIAPGDAKVLDAVARKGRVIGGLTQWQEMFKDLAGQEGHEGDSASDESSRSAAGSLGVKFQLFVQRLTPPEGEHPLRDFVAWLEELIGSDPMSGSVRYTPPEEPTSLNVVHRVRDAPDEVGRLDLAALRALKDVLRGLVWAEQAVQPDRLVDFARFFSQLAGAIDAARYDVPGSAERVEIVVADVVQARGVPFRAVAVLGLAEGEFPTTLREHPLLLDADRKRLREDCGLPIDPFTESAEAEFFYETITCARERLLLTRPRLADSGAPWPASPYWEEVLRLVELDPRVLSSEDVPAPEDAASWPELMESLATHHGYGQVREWARRAEPGRMAAVRLSADVFRLRGAHAEDSPFDGALYPLASELGDQFGRDHVWSSSRLEEYRTCPLLFFVASVLGLEPREEPMEGPDARQLGSIYHDILEAVYQAPGVEDTTDLDQLLTALPGVASRVLDGAPRREGFRKTAWWAHTRQEIIENIGLSLVALEEERVELNARLEADLRPLRHEVRFSRGRALTVADGDDRLRLRGRIDRVDRSSDGRLLIIDYKTSGPSNFSNRAVADGEKLQLPLYALAARDGLKLGEPVEGFYWHVPQCKRSPFTLSGFERREGKSALDVALRFAWETVRRVRRGCFVPDPPRAGCPWYCPAAGFCWQYRPSRGG